MYFILFILDTHRTRVDTSATRDRGPHTRVQAPCSPQRMCEWPEEFHSLTEASPSYSTPRGSQVATLGTRQGCDLTHYAASPFTNRGLQFLQPQDST